MWYYVLDEGVPSMQINRLLEIVYVLLRQKSVTAKELAGRFEVSQRTIYRDIDTLSLAGIPVYTEKGKGGGISLLPEFVLNKLILSEQEQNEILASLQGLSNVTTADTNQVMQKLSAIFNKSAVRWLEVDFSDWDFRYGQYFNDLKTAILERRIAEFDYYSSYGEKTHRRAEPIQLWFKSKAWYIKCFCLKHQDVRLFKLSRIKNLEVTNTAFDERDLLAARDAAGPEKHQKPDVYIKFRVEPEMAYRVFDEFDEDCVVKLPDGGFIVSVIWPEDEWVYGTLLSYGEYIEVLEPGHIRENIKNKLMIIMKKYIE